MLVKKHHYFLVEVLIALSLILLCIVPLMQNPIKFFQSERKELEKLEYERISDLTFLELKEKLYKNEIPWKLKHTKEETASVTLSPFTLKINDDYKKQIPRSYQMWFKREKGNSKETYRILVVQIQIGEKEKPNEYKVFVKKTL
ncbi:MAG: hypothetical protein HZB76_07390 [Chlamydiae bacterium]|nr:hypothetical protein [Chlamydiota bacterium]